MQTYPIQNVGAPPETLFICQRNPVAVKSIVRIFKGSCGSKTKLTISDETGRIIKVETDHLWCKQDCPICIAVLDKAKEVIKL